MAYPGGDLRPAVDYNRLTMMMMMIISVTDLPEERREADERVSGERAVGVAEGAARVAGHRAQQAPQELLQLGSSRPRHALARPQRARRERDARHLRRSQRLDR